jgi:hypothetical protein
MAKKTKELIQCHGPYPMTGKKTINIYAAAYSVADLIKLCKAAGYPRVTRKEVREYWVECWTIVMKDIPVERSVWVEEDYKLRKVFNGST